MEFVDYLIQKKIDPSLFEKKDKETFVSWKLEFEQMHPESFTAQKKFKINPLRRKLLLRSE